MYEGDIQICEMRFMNYSSLPEINKMNRYRIFFIYAFQYLIEGENIIRMFGIPKRM